MSQIFISYSHRDEQLARTVSEAFERNGFRVWRDDRLPVGASFTNELDDAVMTSDAVLFLITEEGVQSTWMRREVAVAAETARANDILLVPVFAGVDPSDLPARLPYELATRRGFRLSLQSQPSLLDLVRAVEGALSNRLAHGEVLHAPIGIDDVLDRPAYQATVATVLEAFSSAGRPLHADTEPGHLQPGPVWVATEVTPSAAEVARFAACLMIGSLGFFVHTGELRPDARIALDQLRLGGKPVVTISVRSLRAALADGRVEYLLQELEYDYGTRDNLFDTKNALINERFLFGRDKLLNTIGSAIRRNEHVLVTGLRKSGKTSLLNILRQHIVDQPVCMVDLQRFDRHGEDWPTTLFGLMLEAYDRWGATEFEHWPFAACRLQTTSELDRELDRRRSEVQGRGRSAKLVVILDELERVFPARGEDLPARNWIRAAGTLRALGQGQSRHVVVIGADLRPIANRENDLGPAGTNPFFTLLQEMPVPLLDADAVADMVEELAQAMGIELVHKAMIERLFGLTGGHPSLIRTIAAEAYRQRRRLYILDEDDLDAALDHLDDQDTIGFFLRNNFWQLMSQPERDALRELVAPPALRAQRKGSPHKQALATLRQQGLVEGTAIRIGLFADWLQESEQD